MIEAMTGKRLAATCFDRVRLAGICFDMIQYFPSQHA